jgi:hypothetical protein
MPKTKTSRTEAERVPRQECAGCTFYAPIDIPGRGKCLIWIQIVKGFEWCERFRAKQKEGEDERDVR